MRVLVNQPDFRLVEGDAFEIVKRIRPESIDAIVTSPPYPNGRFEVKPAEYPDWLAPLLIELARVIRPDGSLMLNLGRVFRGGEESDYMERTLYRAQILGWKRIDTLVWYKPNANARGGRYLTDAHELVYWLALDTKAYRGIDEARRPYAPGSAERLRRRWVAHSNVKGDDAEPHRREPNPLGAKPQSVRVAYTGREKGNPHPTPMPVELAIDLLRLASPPVICEFCGPLTSRGALAMTPGGEVCEHSRTRWRESLVLDPFGGSGTTAVACRGEQRRSLLIERDPEVAAYAFSRMADTYGPQLDLADADTLTS